MKDRKELSIKNTMKKFPRITAHIIAESLGNGTPSRAASILRDAIEGEKNYCEWIYSCYSGDAFRIYSWISSRRIKTGCFFSNSSIIFSPPGATFPLKMLTFPAANYELYSVACLSGEKSWRECLFMQGWML